MQLRTFKTSDGCKAYFAIDTLINNNCCGGVRIKEGLSAEEVKALAYEMTLKLGFWRLVPFGGAKFGMSVPDSLDFKERAAHISELAACLNYSLGNVCYFPGTDLGSSIKDLALIKKFLQLNSMRGMIRNLRNYKSLIELARGAVALFKKRSVNTAYYAALTSVEALKEYSDYCNLKPRTAAIEGFGKVGKNVAVMLEALGIKVVGVSTSKGAIYNKKGLPVSLILRYAKVHYDSFVNVYPAKHIPKEGLLSLGADAFMPCADSWSINRKNVGNLSSKLVIPAANIPATPKAELWMSKNGIRYLPSFICNCGGVAAAVMEKMHGRNASVELLKAYRECLWQMIKATEQKKEGIMAASDIVSGWFEGYKSSLEKRIF